MRRMPGQIVMPDYENCGLNIASAVLQHFGAACAHVPQKEVQALLQQKNYKNIVVMLFDGLGCAALEEHLPQNAFLRSHMARRLTAVFPATTVAATTSIESGEAPLEHGWIGWSQYLAPVDRMVDLFLDRDSLTHEKLGEDKSIARRYLPYRTICEKLNETGRVQAHMISPFGTDRVHTLDDLFDTTRRLCRAQGRRYLYAYWPEPDHTMHEKGTASAEKAVQDIDRRTEEFCRKAGEDTLVLITADHGLTNCELICLEDYPQLTDMCSRPFGLEARDAAFYVKEECREAFPAAFEKALGDKDFWLIESEKAIRMGLLGHGRENGLLRESLGDYLAVSAGKYALSREFDPHPMIGMHAGMTKDEMLVPLIVGKC